ncbi:MAG TPA: hypothetical protein VI136_12525 [Verrucomicrobiae bacterium]
MWNTAFEVRGGLGYKDNVTLSPNEAAEASGFWLSRAEAMIFRLPSQGWQFNFFATADDVRYFDAESVDSEQVVMAVAQLNKDFGHGWKSTLGLNYLYQNQVFDMSATYTNGGSIGLVQGHMLSPRLSGRKNMGPGWVELGLSGTRQILAEPLDSYWQTGPRLAAGWNYGRGSEVSLAYNWVLLDYDSREQSDLAGMPLTNTMLELQTHAVELAWTHVFDEERHWQTTTRLGFESTHDNGSGYYDYALYRAFEQVRYRAATWDLTAQVGAGFYDYAHQTVSATDLSPRQRWVITVAVRAEKKLTKHLKVFASYALDDSISDLEFDDYVAHSVMGGLGIEF